MGMMMIKKLAACMASIVIGVAITKGFIWFFAIEVAPLERWLAFPTDWRIWDLIMNALAALILFGATRAAYQVFNEVWIKKTNVSDATPET